MLNATQADRKQERNRGESTIEQAIVSGLRSPSANLVGVPNETYRQRPELQAGADGALAMLRVLVVDDDAAVRGACSEIAAGMGFQVSTAANVSEAQVVLKSTRVDLLLLDLKLPGSDGLSLLREVKTLYPDTGVLVMTAFATVSSAVEAMRIGAGEYLTKPFALEELTHVLQRAARQQSIDIEGRKLRETLRTQRGMGDLIGHSPEMEKLYRILSKVTTSSHPVLILGESGTGKELVARSIHRNGPNAAKPFVPVDCGALVPTLIESELFGYVKGAFTGADRDKTGLLATTAGGTVFLDEIGELPLDLQAKLLRALQEKEIRPVGATRTIPISARVLAATNRDLITMVEQGKFRKDLYYRLNVVNLKVPPLRERRSDIRALAEYFLERQTQGKPLRYTFSDEVLQWLTEYNWPGNVRELEHAIEHLCALSSGPILRMADMPTQLKEFQMQAQSRFPQGTPAALTAQQASGTQPGIIPPLSSSGGVLSIADMEKHAILTTIQHLRGDKLMAARLLGIGKTTLYRKLKEYGIAEGGDEAIGE